MLWVWEAQHALPRPCVNVGILVLKKWLLRHVAPEAAQLMEAITAPGLRILLYRTSEVHRECYAGVPKWIVARERARGNREPWWDSAQGYPSKTRAIRAMLGLAEENLRELLPMPKSPR